MPYREEAVCSGRTISIETGNWAKQAHGSVVYRCGSLVLLATVCADKEAKEGQEFFPLTVDYREKLYSVGRVPGGYIKRENKPGEHETLLSRIIDRPIRPLFPEGYFSEVQLLVTVLSADKTTAVEGHAITAASAALAVSDIPFHGAIAAVVIGRVDGKFVADPSWKEMQESDIELVVAGSKTAITMIEGGAREISTEGILEAVDFAHKELKAKIELQEKLAAKLSITKREVTLRIPDENLLKQVREFAFAKLETANQNSNKQSRADDIDKINKATIEHFKTVLAENTELNPDAAIKDVKRYLHTLEYEVVRNAIFQKGIRADGRKTDEIREISVELDVLPNVHGSAVFTRGQTQSLGVVTLGTVNDQQRYENLAGQQHKSFMLHYNFPPFSTGEVKRMMGPGRREIGHGNLAERSLRYVMPKNDEFPYAVRVVSEILESNGSSSMASVCSGSLAMMAAGIPVSGAVSGIAMGLFTDDESDKFAILSDIAGLEDHFGDMDFKVAGTEKGITGFQLDIKVTGISIATMKAAIEQAERGRLHILSKMNEAIKDPRTQVAENAPRVTTIQIDQERIGELIGPGGKMIRSIIEKSGAEINVEDTGIVTIASVDKEANAIARAMIEDIFSEVEVGKLYMGTVKKIADFGAFVEIGPGKEGLLHISKLSPTRVNSVRDVVKEGDKIEVAVIGVDKQGRIDFAHKDMQHAKPFQGGGRSGSPGGRGGDRDRAPRDDDGGGRDGGGHHGPRRR